MRKSTDGERVSVLSTVIMTAIGVFEISVGFLLGVLGSLEMPLTLLPMPLHY